MTWTVDGTTPTFDTGTGATFDGGSSAGPSAPTITANPSNASVSSGTSATFSAAATGSPASSFRAATGTRTNIYRRTRSGCCGRPFEVKIKVAKNRQGRKGVASLNYEGRFWTFTEREGDRQW